MKIEWLQVLVALALGVLFGASIKAAFASLKTKVSGG